MKSVNVAFIDFQHHRVVVDSVFVLAQLGVAVRSVVERLYIVLLPVLNLKGIVFNSTFKLVHFPVHKPAVRINNRVRWVQLNRPIKVVD